MLSSYLKIQVFDKHLSWIVWWSSTKTNTELLNCKVIQTEQVVWEWTGEVILISMFAVWKEHWYSSVARLCMLCTCLLICSLIKWSHIMTTQERSRSIWKSLGAGSYMLPSCLPFPQIPPGIILQPRAQQGLSDGALGFCELGQIQSFAPLWGQQPSLPVLLLVPLLTWGSTEETNLEESEVTWPKWAPSEQRGWTGRKMKLRPRRNVWGG